MEAPLAQWGGAPGENILCAMVHHGETWKKTERWSHKKMGKTIHKLVCEDNRLIDDASVYDPHWQFISYKWIDNLPPFWGSYNPALNKDTVPDSGGGVSAGQEKTRDKIAHIILNNERDTTVDLNLYPYLYLHNTISMSKNNVHLHVHVYISSPKKKSWGVTFSRITTLTSREMTLGDNRSSQPMMKLIWAWGVYPPCIPIPLVKLSCCHLVRNNCWVCFADLTILSPFVL